MLFSDGSSPVRVWSDRVFPGNPYRSGNNPAAQRAALPFGSARKNPASGDWQGK